MFGSRSKYFHQSHHVLSKNRRDMVTYLTIKGYTEAEIKPYTDAYDYFCYHPSEFDGATIVKDLVDLYDLDLDAMLHDYEYIVHKAGHNFKDKWTSDLRYAKGIDRKGKSAYAAWSRFVGLLLTGILFVPYTNIKTYLSN